MNSHLCWTIGFDFNAKVRGRRGWMENTVRKIESPSDELLGTGNISFSCAPLP